MQKLSHSSIDKDVPMLEKTVERKKVFASATYFNIVVHLLQIYSIHFKKISLRKTAKILVIQCFFFPDLLQKIDHSSIDTII